MKRIAALAAVMIGLLAIPTAAMASTGGSGSGSGTTVSLQPKACYYGFLRVHRHHQRYFEWRRHGWEYRTVTCPFPLQIPLPQPQPQPEPEQCLSPQTLTFSVAASSSVITEVCGPRLYPTEEFVYDGNTYTITTVDPGAHQFTALVNGNPFTNKGAAITNASGAMAYSSS